jgi:metal-sulfur cluster biosynthetic enzyme
MRNDDLATEVKQALKAVIDPELGYNIVDLGFVYDVSVEDGLARIAMTATSRGCPAAAFLKQGAAASAQRVRGVQAVEVRMTFDPPWQPGMIASDVKASLGFAEVN